MNITPLQQNWAVVVALALLLLVVIAVLRILYRRSARGQLIQALKALRKARREQAQTEKSVQAAEQRLARLQQRAARTKPRLITEAGEAVTDSRALAKIKADRVLVAANHVRRIIFEEFPPDRHETLRKKYLPEDKPDSRPFSF